MVTRCDGVTGVHVMLNISRKHGTFLETTQNKCNTVMSNAAFLGTFLESMEHGNAAFYITMWEILDLSF